MLQPDTHTIGKSVTLIGICGGSASGKTTLAKALQNKLGAENCATLSMDSYYKNRPEAQTAKVNFDEPDSFDLPRLIKDLNDLKEATPVEVPVYDFATHIRRQGGKLLNPLPYIFVEGLFLFNIPKLNKLLSYRIYIDTSASERLVRRINRDMHMRARSVSSVVEQYVQTVAAMHKKHVAPNKNFADWIIDGGKTFEAVISDVIEKITQK